MNHISAAPLAKKMFSDTSWERMMSQQENIIVDGIKDFPASPHDVNKKAYISKWVKGQKKSIHPDWD